MGVTETADLPGERESERGRTRKGEESGRAKQTGHEKRRKGERNKQIFQITSPELVTLKFRKRKGERGRRRI